MADVSDAARSRPPVRYLVPMDGSKCSLKAFDWCVRLARPDIDHITLLNCSEEATSPGAQGRALLHDKQTDLELCGFGAENNDIVQHSGAPREIILEEIRSRAIDVVVMGSVGLNPRRSKSTLGSVAEHVIMHSPTSCACVVMKQD
eukprot:EC789145.1.p2 GENE.EC789145.1~~EC789145.1.p2  ORF type:complete len:146 (+),score=31.78 EC789145.1:63-500(+)